jgi:hypothetical protein
MSDLEENSLWVKAIKANNRKRRRGFVFPKPCRLHDCWFTKDHTKEHEL